jgi:hypothetical protein
VIHSYFGLIFLLATISVFFAGTRVNHAHSVLHGFHRGFVTPYIIIDEGTLKPKFDRPKVTKAVDDYFSANCNIKEAVYKVTFNEEGTYEELVISFYSPIILDLTYQDELVYSIVEA